MAPHLSFEALTPTAFLERAALVHTDRTAVVDGGRRTTYGELAERCLRLAGSLRLLADGGPVAVLAPNRTPLLEAHYAVPWSGSPLVPLNTRLRAGEVAAILEHAGARVLLHDADDDVVDDLRRRLPALRTVRCDGPADEYEGLVGAGPQLRTEVDDERSLLSINYTSGTTGSPKGVMYHHRGAYLQSLSMVIHAGLTARSNYLWTLPMFHCHGWAFTWAVTAVGATHVCLPRFDAAQAWRLIDHEAVTHLAGAPTVLTMLADGAGPEPPRRVVQAMTGGAPPTPALLRRLAGLGIAVTHLYGLTETFGPAAVNDWLPEWDALDDDEQARRQARQGVGSIVSQRVRVVAEDGTDVPADGTTLGEIALRGNNVMLGYFRDPEATAAAAPGGWFRTGDLGVTHPDGFVELRDRKKDIIISGGENISSVEVERALAAHPAVSEVAVVAAPDQRWGEVPVAFVQLKPGQACTAEELDAFARDRLAGFKVPRRIVFGDLPRTATGKVQKFVLRTQAGATDHPDTNT